MAEETHIANAERDLVLRCMMVSHWLQSQLMALRGATLRCWNGSVETHSGWIVRNAGGLHIDNGMRALHIQLTRPVRPRLTM